MNELPQLTIRKNDFSFYWAVWRTLNPAERGALESRGGKGQLVSRRSIQWNAFRCGTRELARSDGENFYYLDAVKFAPDGKIVPIAEAPRGDWLYFVMANFNSLHAISPGASVKGTYGEIVIEAEHYLMTGDADLDDARFGPLTDFTASPRHHPYQWPVYFDERAHKPHSEERPQLLDSETLGASLISRSALFLRVLWSACEGSVQVVALAPVHGIPSPGPTRPGRTEKGKSPLKILERSDWRDVPAAERLP